MTLTKFISIENLGRFVQYRAAGDVGFDSLTLIYGDNGSGKTTLTSLLSSLASGDASPITERATLGVEDPPVIEVRSSTSNHLFDGSEWSSTFPSLDVFDDSFVRDNVHAGDVVGLEQRRNLYQVVVGPAAVAMAKQIDRLDSDGRALARQVSQAETAVRDQMQSPFDLEEFLQLAARGDTASEIARLTRELSAARNAQDVMNRSELTRYGVPDSPRGLLGILGETVEGLSKEAERRVREHIADHLDDRGEAWVRQGLAYVDDENTCPFCTQDLAGISLVHDFSSFFSAAYREHIVALQRALNEVELRFGSETTGRVETTALENKGRLNLWEDLVDASDLTFDAGAFRAVTQAVREELRSHLQAKLRSPGDAFTVSDELEAAVRDFEAARNGLLELNQRIHSANEWIARFKKETATADQAALEAKLRRFRNIEIRNTPAVSRDVDALIEIRDKKSSSDTQKAALRETLREEAAKLLSSYESDINAYLARFGATFRIVETGPSFAGGRASSTYRLAVNNVEVDLGRGDTPKGIPCFRTALSAGDKSTLALAFFLARLDRKKDLAQTIVVFDDPLTSLDAFRTSFTQQTLVGLVDRAAQVIVLSHDPFFLKGIDDYFDGAAKTLRLGRTLSSATVIPWDIDEYCLAQAHRDYFVLRRFLDEGVVDQTELITVARSIRPYLEGYLRNRFPKRFPRGLNFGKLIAEIRDADDSDALSSLKLKADELTELNSFTRRFHHADTGGPPVTVSESELRTWSERAIQFVQAG